RAPSRKSVGGRAHGCGAGRAPASPWPRCAAIGSSASMACLEVDLTNPTSATLSGEKGRALYKTVTSLLACAAMALPLAPVPADVVTRDAPAPDLAAGIRVDADPAFAAEGERLVSALGSGSAPVLIRRADHSEEGYALSADGDSVVIEAA